MEKDFVFGYHHRYMMSPNPNLFSFPIDSGHLKNEPVCENHHAIEESTSRKFPLYPFSGMQQSEANEPINSQNWLLRMPQFHKASPPLLNSIPKEKFPLFDFRQPKSLTTSPTPKQKRFLVFDQSGDKTTMIYNSGIPTPVQFGASWVPNFPTTYNLSDRLRPPSMNDENKESNSRDFVEDEMREDTEELNALLCSDNDYSEDDEETSTGHSPSTMTGNILLHLVEEIGEEVDSFAGPIKRQKISNGGYNKASSSNGRVVSSFKTFASSGLEDDAESSCGDANKLCKEELDLPFRGKRSRREKIHETLGVLQSIFPNVKGKDAITVIDEAINHLVSLKVKVKSLGLDAL